MKVQMKPPSIFYFFRSLTILACMAAARPAFVASQVKVVVGRCDPSSHQIADRVACFVKVREYADEGALLPLVSPNYVRSMISEYSARYRVFQGIPSNISREDRIRELARKLGSPSPDSALLSLYTAVFDRLERGDSSPRAILPLLSYLFLWRADRFTIETLETEVVAQTSTTARLYLTQRLKNPSVDQLIDLRRRFVFPWVKENGQWYLAALD